MAPTEEFRCCGIKTLSKISYNKKTQCENCFVGFFYVEEANPKNLLKPNTGEMAQVHNYLVVKIDYHSLVA